ncbi:hypothetical protein DWB84_11010 [Saccharophagus sp. K07]|jgi:hypothetical protein|uniref:hypothetical protein n=1 Tax=Saccharophagus sp. K07 TaxID=2283636 RepID=UPI0016524F9E|nr:hypothetical protein [Saccharophagus sp. K07]MBC6905987.1 hypothetical protein [Saccharophagus sp. K07]
MSDEHDIEENEEEIEAEAEELAEDDDVGAFTAAAPTGDYPVEESVVAREALRQQIQSDVEAFLARGGVIHEIPPNVVSDPPRKPQSNYGGQPI